MNSTTKSKLQIDIVNVGHGDCIIITWRNNFNQENWHCIIDSGDGSTTANTSIDKIIIKRKIKKFDLAILTHFDSDHIGGFSNIIDKVKVLRYWSPYTPAFEKYLWLFGQRGINAIKRAKSIEEKLLKQNALIESPVEGCMLSPTDGLKITVLSPPIKIFEKLLEEKDIESLFGQYPTFLGDLVIDNNDIDLEQDQRLLVQSMYSRLFKGMIRRNLVEENKEINNDSTQINLGKIDIDKQLICNKMKVEPEFFGNNVLNDTSLVFKIDCFIEKKWFSMLFPGDLENWLYLIAKHSNILKSDFYKASHHGSKAYVGNDEAYDEVIQTIRPNITVVSANGKHKLPRIKTRNSLIRWSTNVFCTQNRCNEYFNIDGSLASSGNNSCFDFYKCKSKEGSICFKLEQNKISVNSQSCYGTYSVNNYPVIQFQQHLIPDDSILTRLTENEIIQQTKWVLNKLKVIHEERKKGLKDLGSEAVTSSEIYSISLQENRNLVQKQIDQIFEYGYSNNYLWASNERGRWQKAYSTPGKDDIRVMWNIIKRADILLLNIKELQKGISSNILNASKDLLSEYIEKQTAFPKELVETYCWPLLIKTIIRNYECFGLTYTTYKSAYVWLLLVKYDKDYGTIMADMLSDFKTTFNLNDDYFYLNEDQKFYEYSKSFINEGNIIRICSSLRNDYNNKKSPEKLAISNIFEILNNKREVKIVRLE
ncbi:ComEC/Rec2 family competence protein [Desulfosporosinus lacus]|uniref:Metallo-beta-lactamase superfamily protein n=1 Tax=Desulfosporosinus lacus DSM 15449 TaxID=1121420 RepID=A0A1M6AFJ4_9FIRM|nr:MBL fold metallo-hydrolase [Desulfosporosinus lacus]SHI35316.1 Metallo-beta-lactamase superfamily protein [Desulfosporosinus lacus DSM 15449]